MARHARQRPGQPDHATVEERFSQRACVGADGKGVRAHHLLHIGLHRRPVTGYGFRVCAEGDGHACAVTAVVIAFPVREPSCRQFEQPDRRVDERGMNPEQQRGILC
jgi:hypothetical protein